MRWIVLCIAAGGVTEVDELEHKGAFKEAAQACLRSPDLWLRAAGLFEKAHLIGQAIATRERYLREHPDSPAVVLELARSYEKIGSFSEATRFYHTLAQKFPGERDASSALLRAIHIEGALGLADEQRRDLDLFARNYRKESARLAELRREPTPPAPKLIAPPWVHLDSQNPFLAQAMTAHASNDRRGAIAAARRAIAVGEADGWALMAAAYDDHPALARLVIETARQQGTPSAALEIVDGYLSLEANQRPQAEAAFRRALALSPGNADAQAGLAR